MLSLLDRAIPIEEQLSARLDQIKEDSHPGDSLRKEITDLTRQLQRIVDQAQGGEAAAALARLKCEAPSRLDPITQLAKLAQGMIPDSRPLLSAFAHFYPSSSFWGERHHVATGIRQDHADRPSHERGRATAIRGCSFCGEPWLLPPSMLALGFLPHPSHILRAGALPQAAPNDPAAATADSSGSIAVSREH